MNFEGGDWIKKKGVTRGHSFDGGRAVGLCGIPSPNEAAEATCWISARVHHGAWTAQN